MNTDEICQTLREFSNLDKVCVSKFCVPIEIDTKDTCEPCITIFKVDAAVIKVLPKFEKLQHSFVFLKIWESCCNSLKQNCATLEDVVTHVWAPVEKRLVDAYFFSNR